MASPGAIASSRLGQAGKAQSKIKSLQGQVEAAASEAARFAAGQRSTPLPAKGPPLRVPMGQRASTALGDDIPRPMPGPAEKMGPPTGGLSEVRGEWGPEDIPDFYRAVEKLRTVGPEGMSVEEMALLYRMGSDLNLLMAGPLPQKQVAAILRKVENEGIGSLTPEEMAGLARTVGTPSSSVAPTPPPAPAAVEPGAVRPFYQQGGKFIGEDGSELKKIGDEQYQYPDGTVVDFEGKVVGSYPTTDLTDELAVTDDLEPQATPVETDAGSPRFNTTPNKQKQSPLDRLAEDIRRATTPSEDDPVSQKTVRNLQRQVDSLSEAERDALRQHPRLAEGIENLRAQQDEAELAAAIERADARLGDLRQMANSSVNTRGQAAALLEAATAKRQIPANAARATGMDAAQQALRAARDRVGQSLPEGDWGALAAAFNAMPAERREAVLGRLSSGQSLAPEVTSGRAGFDPAVFKQERNKGDASLKLDSVTETTPHPLAVRQGPVDATAGRPFIESLLERDVAGPSLTPNALAQLTRPVNEFEAALIRLDAAKRSGDAQAIAAASDDVRSFPASEEQIAAAKQSFFARQRAASELRNAIIGTDPDYLTAQSTAAEIAASPSPRQAIAPGARTPSVPTTVPGRADEPSAANVAMAVDRERDVRLSAQAAGGGFPEDVRKQFYPGRKNKDVPLAFKGDDTATPLETRPDSARFVNTSDVEAIQQANELKAALQEIEAELQVARLQVALARRAPLSGQSVSPQELDEVVRTLEQKRSEYRNLLDSQDKMFPPRLVKLATGEFKEVPAAMLSGKMEVPNGWVIERGQKARAQKRLDARSQQETLDEAIVNIVGFRPTADTNLPRSTPGLTPEQRAVSRQEYEMRLGEDIDDEALPDAPDDDVSGGGKRPRPGRLGGQRQQSRLVGSLRTIFNDDNPLQVTLPPQGENFAQLAHQTPAELATKTLAKNTIFTPGTASYELAHESLTNAIEAFYGENGRYNRTVKTPKDIEYPAMEGGARRPEGYPGDPRDPMTQDPQDVPPLVLQGRQGDSEGFDEATSYIPNRRGEVLPQRAPRDFSQPETVLTPEQLAELAENEDAASIAAQLAEIKQSVTGSDVAASGNPTGADVGTGRPVDQSVEDKLNASDPSGTDIGGTPAPSGDASVNAKLDASATSLDAAAPATLSKEALDALREQRKVEYARLLEEEKASGVRDREARNNAEQRADEWFHEEVARRTASQSGAAPLPDAAGPLDPPPAQPSPAAVDADTPATGTPVESDAAAQRQADNAKDEAAKKAVTGEGTDGQQPAPGPTPRTWGQWLWRAGKIGGGLTAAGTGGLYVMQPKSGPAPIDIPPSSPVPPLPPGFLTGSGTAGDPAADEAAAIERALERIRGGRSSSTQSAPYATIQNPTMWR